MISCVKDPLVISTSYPTFIRLYPIEENGKWGYINEDGETVITPAFDSACDFSERLTPELIFLAAIVINDKWGYIDTTGDLAIDIIFDEAMKFSGRIGCSKN